MATTTPTKKPAAGRRFPRSGEDAMTSLQQVIDDLDRLRDETGEEVRTRLDAAVARMRETAGELRERTDERTASVERAVRGVADDAWQQIAMLAVRAQSDPAALTELAAEIRKRKAELKPAARGTTKAR